LAPGDALSNHDVAKESGWWLVASG
jgi:hypothetical protein